MLKKTLIAASILAASTSAAFANGGTMPMPVATHVGNAYVGFAGSRDFVHYDLKGTTEQTDPFDNETDVVNFSSDFGGDGWNGEIYGGYGWVFQDHYYLGAEIFGSLSNASADASFKQKEFNEAGLLTASNRAKLSGDLDYTYGISLIPGVKVSDSTMLYGRVGWARSKFELKANATDSNGDHFHYSADDKENGIQLGLGMEAMITNNVSARLEYDWTRYSDIKLGKFAKIDHPIVNQAKLGVAYHFMAV